MPRVPNYQPGQVGPVRTTNERFTAPATAGGLGVIAEGFAGAARVAATADKIQAEKDETDARQRALEFQRRAAPIVQEASLAKGVNAEATIKDANASLLALRNELAKTSRSYRAREAFLPAANSYLTDYQAQLAHRQAIETRAVTLETLQAQADLSSDEAVNAWGDPAIAEKHLATGMSVIRRRAEIEGRSGELLDADLRDYRSKTRKAAFNHLIAQGEWDVAIAYQAAHEDELTAEDSTAIAASLRVVKQNRQSFADGTAALAQGIPVTDIPRGGKYSMPVKAGKVTSAFGAARGSSTHNGVDWAAPQGSDVRPMAAGEVVRVDSDPRSGKFVIVDHGDGTTTSYSHLGRQDVKVGDKVTPSTSLGIVGMTGHTTGPHVHVVARQHGKAIDPVSLLGSDGSGSSTQGRKAMDQRAAYAWIDQQDWSFERKQLAKDGVDRQIGEQDQLRAREERDADRQASERVLRLGDNFTSVDQLGALVNKMSPDSLRSYVRVAATNSKPRDVPANGFEFLKLSRIAHQAPEQFADINLGEYVGKVTRAELVRLSDDQARIINGGDNETALRSQIEGTISTFVPFTISKEDRIRVHDSMSSYLRALTSGKRAPTSAELRDALNASIRTVTVERPGTIWGTNTSEKRVFDMTIDDVPERDRNLARNALRNAGQEETDDAVVSLYLQKLARQQANGQ